MVTPSAKADDHTRKAGLQREPTQPITTIYMSAIVRWTWHAARRRLRGKSDRPFILIRCQALAHTHTDTRQSVSRWHLFLSAAVFGMMCTPFHDWFTAIVVQRVMQNNVSVCTPIIGSSGRALGPGEGTPDYGRLLGRRNATDAVGRQLFPATYRPECPERPQPHGLDLGP